jgi:hypothetical protein
MMTVTLNASESLAGLLVLQPGATGWIKANASAWELKLPADGEGPQQAALKGKNDTHLRQKLISA